MGEVMTAKSLLITATLVFITGLLIGQIFVMPGWAIACLIVFSGVIAIVDIKGKERNEQA